MNRKTDPATIGHRVRFRRQLLRMSQRELAESVTARGIKLSQQNVNSIEAGDVRRPRSLPEIAAVLGTTIDWLRDGTGPEEIAEAADPVSREHAVPSSPRELSSVVTPERGFFQLFGLGDPAISLGSKQYHSPFLITFGFSTMSPAIELDDELVVNPLYPVYQNADCLFLRDYEPGAKLATVQRLLDWDDRHWRVQQFNPAVEQKLSRAEWTTVFIISSINRQGYKTQRKLQTIS